MNGVRIHRTGFDSLKEVFYWAFGDSSARGRVGTEPKKPTLASDLAAWFYRTTWKKLCFPDDACLWFFPARKRAAQLLERHTFDALITVSLPFTGHLIGLFLKKRYPNITWLTDIGDPFSFSPNPLNNSFLFQKLNRRLERRVLETADHSIVTVEAMRRRYRTELGDRAVEKMHVIPPLLTAVHAVSNFQLPNPNPKLVIGFFGALYAPVRTPYALLDFLRKTFTLYPMLRDQLEVHFYGEIFPEFFEALTAEPCVRLHGLCSREAAWAAMQQADILLNIGNATDFQLPSKAVDYLATGRPVLNLSYTRYDPFADFLEKNIPDKSLIFNLKADKDGVGESEVRRWLAWLGAEKTPVQREDLERRLVPFRVEQVAAEYLSRAASRNAIPGETQPTIVGTEFRGRPDIA